ncbi:MAG: OsmC family protein [Methanomassiliicoccales archaeon]|nr:MAG: OsmC family protein [Methanomassiliicoccales archaeon]
MSDDSNADEIKVVKAHVKINWEGGIKTTSLMRGFEVVADGPKWKFGTNSAPAPGEIFLASIGACFTATFTKCAQESMTILNGVYTDVRATIDHEMSGKERLNSIEMELTACAEEKFKKELQKCFEKAKTRCPLTNAVKCEMEIAYKFKKE